MKLLCAVLLTACLSAADLRVGRGSVPITPPAGIPLAGYFNVRLAQGTHDELYAKALVFDTDGEKAALVACDLIGLDRAIIEAARRRIAETEGIPADRVMISATHSHTGPLMDPMFLAKADGPARKIAQEYIAGLPARIAAAVSLASRDLTAVRVRTATGREESVSFNRRFFMKDGTVRFNPGKRNPDIVRPAGPIDPELPVVSFEALDGKPLALAINFAMHLDTVGGAEFSADYPHVIADLLGRVHGPGTLSFFTLGTAGNLNHIDVASREPQSGHAEARRLGTVLAGEVIKASARLHAVPAGAPRAASEMVELPLAQIQPGAVEKARRVDFEKAPFLDVVDAFKVIRVAEQGGRPIPAEVQVIALGDQIAWVGLPGEIFVEVGLAIKKASPFPVTIVTELANGSIGYVPDRAAYAQGAYEVITSRVAPGSGESLVESALRLLGQLHRKAAAGNE